MTIRHLAKIIGMLVAASSAILYSKLYVKTWKRDKTLINKDLTHGG